MRPFSEKYNERYESIYAPAIKSAGLAPVHGGGAGAVKLMDDIERKIYKTHICMADISEDNLNVFIEVGIALAFKKPIAFVCDKGRRPNMADVPSNLQGWYVAFFKDTELEKARKEIGEHLFEVKATLSIYRSMFK